LKTRTCLAGALLGIGALAGCGSTDAGADAPLVEGVTEEVGVLDNTFRPEQVTVSAGTEVVWDNGGRNDHNVLPVEGDEWGVEADDFAPGDVYRHRFTEPGTYAYYCSLHGTTTAGMVGTIVVTG
jgi:plastocyanin